jgi:hypothetical protein
MLIGVGFPAISMLFITSFTIAKKPVQQNRGVSMPEWHVDPGVNIAGMTAYV